MKMEVVLSSPGRFGGDDTPFKNEEVREWSRVDRLTGMLERARIETGRWRTNNDSSAHSYGKVTDQRERNSADGSVIQKAKRQVEIFQSQEPGRSVQVVRASQWSSSRVTDYAMDNIMPLECNNSVLNEINEVLKSDPWEMPALKSLSEVSRIHENLKNDKLNFLNIEDSKKNINGLDKYGLSKKSNSDDDLSSLMESDSSSKHSLAFFTRDCKNRRSLQIPTSVSISVPSASESKKKFANKELYSTISSATSGNASSITIGNESKSKSSEYGSLRFKSSPQPLQPTNRSNAVTVVNIMNPESFNEDPRNRKSSIVTLRSPLSITEEKLPTSFPSDSISKTSKKSLTKTNSSGDEGTVNLPSRGTKKVGFCKTEVHFAADSGKVNIVETDGKPPPTNKFRKRRKNQNSTGNIIGNFTKPVEFGVNGKISPRRMIIRSEISDNKLKPINLDNDSSGAYCVVDLDSKKFWTNPDEREGNHKIHATMVSLAKPADQRNDRDNGELKKSKELASPKVVSEVISRRNQDQNNYNVVTKDAENNRVISTAITTHEPTIARVEDNIPLLKKSLEKTTSSLRRKCGLKRTSSLQKKDSIDGNSKKNIITNNHTNSNKDPVYVNVFKVSNSRSPVYENYHAHTPESKSTFEEILEFPETYNSSPVSTEVPHLKDSLEKKRNKVKTSNKSDKRSPESSSRFSTWSGSLGKSSKDSMKMKDVKNLNINGDLKVQRKLSPKRESIAQESEEIKNRSTRLKKQPMEVVYRTAVFNMKNEKLSPTIKRKETKVRPRYINDLICGSKNSRLSNSKHKDHLTSQNANKQMYHTTTSHWK